MLVSPGVAGLDRLRFSGLYLDGVGLNPPTSSWSFLSWPEDRRAPFWRWVDEFERRIDVALVEARLIKCFKTYHPE